MTEEKLLTIRDASLILGISEKEVIELSENGQLPAYKIGGLYLRFKRQQVEEYRRKRKVVAQPSKAHPEHSFNDKARDFLYFNDFYIVSAIIIIVILVIIFRG